MATCDESHVYVGPETESHILRTADSIRLLRGISSRDAETRRQALDVIARTLDGYVVVEVVCHSHLLVFRCYDVLFSSYLHYHIGLSCEFFSAA